MIAATARRWLLAVSALAAVAGAVAVAIIATSGGSQPAPELTLSSTDSGIPEGAMTSRGSTTQCGMLSRILIPSLSLEQRPARLFSQ